MADLLNVLLNEGGLSQRQVAVLRFALYRFVNDAHYHMNAAAQDKEDRYFKPGAVEVFAADAKDAEAVLARFRTCGVTVPRWPVLTCGVPAVADPCPQCPPGLVCKKPTCGRLAHGVGGLDGR